MWFAVLSDHGHQMKLHMTVSGLIAEQYLRRRCVFGFQQTKALFTLPGNAVEVWFINFSLVLLLLTVYRHGRGRCVWRPAVILSSISLYSSLSRFIRSLWSVPVKSGEFDLNLSWKYVTYLKLKMHWPQFHCYFNHYFIITGRGDKLFCFNEHQACGLPDTTVWMNHSRWLTWKPCFPLHQPVSSLGGMSMTDTMSPTWITRVWWWE